MVGRSRAAWAGRGSPAEMSQVPLEGGGMVPGSSGPVDRVDGGTQGVDSFLDVPKAQKSKACWDGCHVGNNKGLLGFVVSAQ